MRTPLALALLAFTALPACAQLLSLDEYRVDEGAGDSGAPPDADAAAPGPDAVVDAAVDAAPPADAASADASAEDAGRADANAGQDASGAPDATPAVDAAPAVDASDAGPPPRVRFLDPLSGGIANVAADNTALLSVEVNGFTLRLPGECRGEPNCGHAHVTIDGTTCNNLPAGKAYNAQLIAPGPVRMNMALCQAGPLGQKTVTVELVQDNHAPFAPREIHQATAFFIRGKVRLTSPLDEDVIAVPANKRVAVSFRVSDFTLRAPGQCGATANCGHLRVTVDGANCNEPGQPYAAIASSVAPVEVDLGRCAGGHLGTKIVRVELVSDTGAPLSPVEANAAQVTFVP